MTSNVWLLLFALLSMSAARFHCPDNCLCTASYSNSGKYQIYYSTDNSIKSGFNITLLPSKYANVECQNSPEWNDFELNDRLIDLGNVDLLVFSGCRLPSIESKIVRQIFGNGWVKFLKVDALKGKLSKRHLHVFPYLRTLVLSNNYLGQVDEDLLYGEYFFIFWKN